MVVHVSASYLFTVELIDGTFNHLISEFCQTTFHCSVVFSPAINTLSVSLYKSVQLGLDRNRYATSLRK